MDPKLKLCDQPTADYNPFQLLSVLTAANGVAESTGDYEMPSATAVSVTFAAGDTSKASTLINIKEDDDVEDTEDFTITLALATADNTDDEGAIISPGTATVFIYDRTCKLI